MAPTWKVLFGISALLVVGSLATSGWGQEASGQEKTGGGSVSGGGSASGGGKEKTGGNSKFRGVTDSYAIAQEEIESEGGEQEAGEYRVGYIVEPAEGWWDGTRRFCSGGGRPGGRPTT